MTPTTLILLLLVGGVVLLVAEMLLPAQGILGVLGAVALAAAVVVGFRVDSRIGFVTFVAIVVATPFAWMLWVKIWPKTPVGRRMILGPVASDLADAGVAVGQTGTCVSELRPMGVCAFGNQRIEARAESGTIPAGKPVRVVEIVDRRPTVRAV
jgi:membrane-bound ClpP family serine protease